VADTPAPASALDPSVERLTRRLVQTAERAGLLLDFDGVLAPIVDDPASSAMPPELAPVLARLARRLGCVAVISGRPVAFLVDRAAVDGVRLLGLYGLQEWAEGRPRARREATAWQDVVDGVKDRIAAALAGVPGVVLEDKGLSVAVHWRNAPDRDRAGRMVGELAEVLAAQTGLAREPGKLVEELRPPVDWDKGASVRALHDELALRDVVYVGDDLGDLAAFAAAYEVGGAAIAVDHGHETPRQLREAADAVLVGTGGVVAWLTALADRLEHALK
jgi:trehalose 6-phosphate phosphatase